MAGKFTPEEKELLVSRFEEMETKPKMDDKDALRQWMVDYVSSSTKPFTNSDGSHQSGKPAHVIQIPRIVNFSGSGDPKEVSYETWKYEVLTLVKEGTHSLKEVSTAAKKSLRGEASNAVRRLGIDADLDNIIHKLDGIYGLVEDSESLLSQFYSAKQKVDEKVSSWGCRLEDLLDRASQQEALHSRTLNDMLRTKFWSGLLPHLKEAARHKVESVRDFDQLRIEVRKIESELPDSPIKPEPRKGQVKMVNAEETAPSEIETVKGMVCKLESKMEELQSAFSSKTKDEAVRANASYHGQWNRQVRGRGRGRFRGNYRGNRNWNQNRWSDGRSEHKSQDTVCYRCNQVGHIAIGCRTDLSKVPLNSKESA